MNASELGKTDGEKARDAKAKRGRRFTPLGACKACGDAFERHMAEKTLTPDAVLDYGKAFVNAALGEMT